MRVHAVVARIMLVVGVEAKWGSHHIMCNHGHHKEHGSAAKNVTTWVHVGKTGSSVGKMLHGCRIASCHVSEGRLKPPVPRDARYLISVRDPIDRVVSAFNWRHPNTRGGVNGSGVRHHTGGNTSGKHAPRRRLRSGQTSHELYACFPLIDDFAVGLRAAGACGALARNFLTEPHAHITMGFEFYLGKVLDEGLLERPYALLHTETLAADVAAAACWLGCSYDAEKHKHDDYVMRNATYVSPAGRANLRDAFRRDYEVLARLEAGPGRVALA